MQTSRQAPTLCRAYADAGSAMHRRGRHLAYAGLTSCSTRLGGAYYKRDCCSFLLWQSLLFDILLFLWYIRRNDFVGRAVMPPLVYELLLLYLGVISLVSICVTAYDKIAASRRPEHRIRESTLFTLALLGGGCAMYITMLLIRHKTLHTSFMLGIPFILLLQGGLVFLCYYLLNG